MGKKCKSREWNMGRKNGKENDGRLEWPRNKTDWKYIIENLIIQKRIHKNTHYFVSILSTNKIYRKMKKVFSKCIAHKLFYFNFFPITV